LVALTQPAQVNIDEDRRFRNEFVVPYLLEQHGACQYLVVAALEVRVFFEGK
jgi:hypothetical protein